MIFTNKRFLVLILLVVCLFGLLLVYKIQASPTPTEHAAQQKETLNKLPESKTVNTKDKKKYRMYHYQITKIEGGKYYGEAKDGTSIIFQLTNLKEPLKEPLAKGEIIRAYFDLKNGATLVKVEKVEE
ncbi:hypothetical protein [Priestia koreensis]|uniref:Uncharacterized protein n=1 Tax=Priestia koreensis TaxID=284581 RepID=A0A0M0KWS2_9BACI|nr:hypothetical protein [Priestia koreensis]KOO42838.1 hypothetical protein AMD01_16995 [Priestia koreensis]MCM3005409.1 hypothetical protein [Priestia koreensis]